MLCLINSLSWSYEQAPYGDVDNYIVGCCYNVLPRFKKYSGHQ